jgi:DNA polymerase-3 subunit epsilon
VVDTLLLARRKHPGGPNRLDDLCVRYRIDNSRRTKHGALLDAEILAEVYIELIGARQAQLILADAMAERGGVSSTASGASGRPVPLGSRVTPAERATHRQFIATLGAAALWREYLDNEPALDSDRPQKPV